MTADWVMVIVTGIYVVATIFICRANIKSAKASREQLKEMQRQYAEANRPNIETEFHYLKRACYILRFVNHGEKTAQHVKISLDQDFIDSLPEVSFRKELERVKEGECIIGVGQHYDLFIGSNYLRGNPNMKPLTGTVEYEAQGNSYKSDIFVDLEHYLTFYSTTTDEEDLVKSIKKVSEELKVIRQTLLAQEVKESDNNQSRETV